MLRKIFANARPNPLSPKATRRGFILGTAATAAGLAVGYSVWRTGVARAQVHPFQPYVSIAADGAVTIYSSQFEMGQGSYFGIATLVNEELDADWSSISVEGASGNVAAYGNLAFGGAMQMTGGSSSMASSFERYRKAGAALRMMLVQAAAREWGVAPAEVTASAGTLAHPSGRTARYGEMAAKAAALEAPADIAFKPREAWTQIGRTDLRRFDSKMKTDGSAQFTIDVKLPRMATAVMLHPPKFGATVRSFDASKARALRGIVDIVQIPRGIAVVAENMWTAIRGRELVTAEWDESNAEQRGSDEILAGYLDVAARAPGATARNEGDSTAALAGAAKTIEAAYTFPYLAHAALEPLNAVARMTDGVLEVWAGHQMPDLYASVAAQIAGVTPSNVKLHVMRTGGGFGRRAVPDADVIAEAVAVAKALNWSRPVKLQWTRDNDMRGGRYRPAYVHALKAGLDQNGNLVAWQNHIIGQSIMAGTPFAGLIQNGIDFTSVEGAANIPYAIPNLHVGLTTMNTGVPVLWWRAVGSTHTAYAVETFLDEVAEAAGKDPVALRLELLDGHPRHAATLRLAAERAGWDTAIAPGRFRGVAVAESFGSVVAQVVEVSVPAAGRIKVEKVVCAVDCGTAINPDQVVAQMEGGIAFGLSSILAEEITMTRGAVDQANYDTYTPLRIDQMPAVEVHIVPSANPPTGVGEPGVPPIGPALANAAYRATGKRVRILPFAKGYAA
jgi:isoquinoline 1-oxidoreductase beta subunit